ncbi:MFS transporter [Bifidobacterium simiarum]|nr:MFS transporter [Bifidobacterium simiarum]
MNPEDGYDPNRLFGLSRRMQRYFAGFLMYSFLHGVAFSMIVSVLMPQHLKDIGLSNPTAMLGMISAGGSLISIFINVIVGSMSDRTRSRFGRRKPWIFCGAIIAGFSYWAIGNPQTGIGVGYAYWFAMIGNNMMIAPIVATLSDSIPQRSRATVSAAYGGGQVVGQSVGTLLGSFFIFQPIIGFIVGGLCMAAGGLIITVINPKDRSTAQEPKNEDPVWKVILETFRPPIKGAADFWKAFLCRTGLIVAYQMITSYQLYILQEHVGLTKADSAAAISVMSIITLVVSLLSTAVSGPISDKIGRRKPLVMFACGLYAVGIAMPWLFPSRMGMFLFAAIAGFGYGMYLAVDQALNVDVLPNPEEAGKDLGILNIATCAGQAIGSGITSWIVTVTAAYTLVFPTAIGIAIFAGVLVFTIKKTK